MIFDFKEYLNRTGEIGFVSKTVSSLIFVEGLPGATLHEVVVFESGDIGEVIALSSSVVSVLSFSKDPVRVGMRVARIGKNLQIPVGERLFGKVINPLGRSIDPGRPVPSGTEFRAIRKSPPGIIDRAIISEQCETGMALIDLLMPIGKGQRELVLGDQKTGKSMVLMRTLLSQVTQGAVGIYAVIGKGKIAIKQVEETLTNFGILDRVITVVTSADDGPGMMYATPYSAMTIAEYFRDVGRNVVLVLDDLSTHARIVREIALLGKRFPGRNSYPGDIFYTHASLLERAGNFSGKNGPVSITCLPVAETVQGDMTGYIITNLMSMTDGHLYFDHLLFAEGRRPAVDVFLSVTRVGRQTQTPLRLEIGRTVIPFLRKAADFRNFASFGSELGPHIKDVLEKEERLNEFFDQTVYHTIPGNLQLILFGFAWGEIWRGKTRMEVRIEIQKLVYSYASDVALRKRMDAYISRCDSIESLLTGLQQFDFSKK